MRISSQPTYYRLLGCTSKFVHVVSLVPATFFLMETNSQLFVHECSSFVDDMPIQQYLTYGFIESVALLIVQYLMQFF